MKPYPKVSPQLVVRLREDFPPLPPQVGESFETMLVRAGRHEVIALLDRLSKEST